MEKEEKETEEKINEKENDIFLKDYLIWKKQFIKLSSVLGVKFKK